MADTIVTITRANTSELYKPLVVNLAVSGTAIFDTDYTVLGATSFTSTSASVIIPANQTSKTITLSSVSNTIVELDKTVVLTLVPIASVSSGNGDVTWTILNDDTVDPTIVLDLNFNPTTPVDRTDKILNVFGLYIRSATAYNSNFSGVFNGTNTLVTAPASNAWDLNNVNNYEIECVISVSNTNLNQQIVGLTPQFTSNGWFLLIVNSSVKFFYDNDIILIETPAIIAANTWVKIKYLKTLISGSNYKHEIFINDVLSVSVNSSVSIFYSASEPLSIGSHERRQFSLFNGLMNSLKIRKF